jgi:hypothetical protein
MALRAADIALTLRALLTRFVDDAGRALIAFGWSIARRISRARSTPILEQQSPEQKSAAIT